MGTSSDDGLVYAARRMQWRMEIERLADAAVEQAEREITTDINSEFLCAAAYDAEESEEADKYDHLIFFPELRHCSGWFHEKGTTVTFIQPEEPVPLADPGGAISISGCIAAIDVNTENPVLATRTDRGTKFVPQPTVYRLTVTLETTDIAAVQHLALVRARPVSSGKMPTADLIVWPT